MDDTKSVPNESNSFPQEHTPAADPRGSGIEQYVQQIKDTADKLLRDGASRGDAKLLATAVKELRYSFRVFKQLKNRRKCTVFGSARTPTDDPTYLAAVEFGKRIADAGFMVITGAASGIMEAGHVGAGRENSVGVNILLPFEQSSNPIISGSDALMHLKYFFTRKLLFVKESDAIALFAGGFGTHDELFEVLTLVQTGKSHLFPIVLVDAPGEDYWKKWQHFVEGTLLPRHLISPADTSLYRVTESVDEAVHEVTSFYRIYHSMRYVRSELVLRLQHAPSPPQLAEINTHFKDILASGSFEVVPALKEESNEPLLKEMPRLKFCFDRRNLGRLRQLVDYLNREVE